MTFVLVTYRERTTDLLAKAPYSGFNNPRIHTYFYTLAAQLLVLLLLIAPGAYSSQLTRLTMGKSPGIPPVAAASPQGTIPYFIPLTISGTSPRALPGVSFTPRALPGIAFTGQLNIRRYRFCDSYKSYLAGITAHPLTFPSSHLLTLSPSHLLTFSPSHILIFPPSPNPQSAIRI